MKFTRGRFSGPDNSGIILLTALWIMAILSVLAIGLGRRTGIDMALTKHALGKLKADYIAWAGFVHTTNRIQEDTQDAVTGFFDNLYQCGVKLEEGKTPRDVFKNVEVADGYFDVGFREKQGKRTIAYYGPQDEEQRINLNAINPQNYKILSTLVMLVGFDEEAANTVASAVVDWHDEDNLAFNPPLGAEDDEYRNLPAPYHCKNLHFDSPEELLLVKGMTPQIFHKIKDYLTVFPKEAGDIVININTAPEIILRTLMRAMSDVTHTTSEDADSVTAKILAYRKGEDEREATADDRVIDLNADLRGLGLNAKEQAIFFTARSHFNTTSNYFRISVTGFDGGSSARSNIEGIVDREMLSIISWRKD